jgi:hypothetical protein
MGCRLLLSLLVVIGLLVVAWALVTQPLLSRAPKAATVNIDHVIVMGKRLESDIS